MDSMGLASGAVPNKSGTGACERAVLSDLCSSFFSKICQGARKRWVVVWNAQCKDTTKGCLGQLARWGAGGRAGSHFLFRNSMYLGLYKSKVGVDAPFCSATVLLNKKHLFPSSGKHTLIMSFKIANTGPFAQNPDSSLRNKE